MADEDNRSKRAAKEILENIPVSQRLRRMR
jgi:hypothetical protein